MPYKPVRSFIFKLLFQKAARCDYLGLRKSERYFSQFGEDVAISHLLYKKMQRGDIGTFVDIGAYDPLEWSNSYFLYEKGWRGICVEPNPEHYRKFGTFRPEDINLNIGISANEADMTYHMYECSPLNTFDKSHAKKLKEKGTHTISEVEVPVKPLSRVLDEYLDKEKSFDLLTVDCEGHDLVVLESNDWGKYRPMILVVEDHSGEVGSEVDRYCESKGYVLKSWIGPSKIYLDSQIKLEEL